MIGQNPDCESPGNCLPSVQDIEVETVTVHENWNPNKFTKGNDIALVRLAKAVILFAVSLFEILFTVLPGAGWDRMAVPLLHPHLLEYGVAER